MNKYVLTINGEPKLEKLEEHAQTQPSNLLSGVIAASLDMAEISWAHKITLAFSRNMSKAIHIDLVVAGDKTHVNMDIYDKLLSYPFIDAVKIRFNNGKAQYHGSINREWYRPLDSKVKNDEN